MNAAPLPGSRRLEDEVAAHRPAQLARDVEPEAAALVGRPGRAAREALEQPLAILLRDAAAMVRDGDAEVAGLGIDRDA